MKINKLKESVRLAANDLAHRHGEGNTTPEERARKLKEATEEVHNAVFGAEPCSADLEGCMLPTDTLTLSLDSEAAWKGACQSGWAYNRSEKRNLD